MNNRAQYTALRCSIQASRADNNADRYRAKKVLAALQSIGWRVKRQSESHKTLEHADYPDYIFAFHDGEEIGPRMLSRIAKHTGLEPGDL